MSKKIKNEQKKFLGETLNQYDKALDEAINQLDKKNREQNHKISSLVNSFDNEYLEKDVEGNMTTLENSKDGMVIINEIQGSTEVNYCKDGEKELILNGDIDTQGESFVTITEGVDGGLVDVSLEGNTEINLSNTKDPVLVTREFDDINCNTGKLQYTIDDVTTINDEPGKVDIDRIVGDTIVNHAVNGSEELILNAHINESGDNNITLNGVTSDSGKVDVALEGNTLVNVSKTKDDYITPSIEDKVDQGSVISLPEVSEGLIHIDEIEGNTLVNYCTDGAKELTLNGDIDVEGTFVTTTEGVDNGLVDIMCEGNTLINLKLNTRDNCDISCGGDKSTYVRIDENSPISLKGEILQSGQANNNAWQYFNFGKINANLLKTDTTYTLIIRDEHKTTKGVFIQNGDITHCFTVNSSVVSTYIGNYNYVILKTKNDFTGLNPDYPILYGALHPEYTGKLDISIIGLFEGDWTNKVIPTEYFEGMKSVGQDDENGHKIEISSQNKNLLLPTARDKKIPIFFKKGTTLTLSTKDNAISNGGNIMMYDVNGEVVWLTIDTGQTSVTKTLPRDIYYMRDALSYNVNYELKYQLEISNTKTSYVEPKQNKKEILINEPLRSVPNGVKDRIAKIGGKYFIERNCKQVRLELKSGALFEELETEDTIVAGIWNYSDKKYHKKNIINHINDIFTDVDDRNNQNEYIYSDGWNANFFIRIKKSRLTENTLQGVKNWLQNNPINLVYELATPTYEPLEIEPTLNTYNEITHISNNSIIPCNMQIKNTGYNAIIKPSTLYTVAVDTDKSGTIGINLGGAEVTTANNVVTITTPETLVDDSLRLHGKGLRGRNIRLLEGDKTNCIPSYFEGIKSSFEDKVQTDGSYKMEISSRNKNIFINKKYFQNDAVLIDTPDDNTVILKDTVPNAYREIFFIIRGLKANVNYVVTSDVNVIAGNPLIALQDINGTDGAFISKTETYNRATFKLKQGHDSIRLRLFANHLVENVIGHIEYRNIQIREETAPETYEASKSNSIQLSSIEPLRGVGNFHDRIVFKDGKLMIERNCKQENMSELKFAGDTSDTMKCLILFKSKPKAISNIFSNSRGYESATKGQMYVQERGNGMTYLWIPTDSMSREEFTNFLNEKNATIVYAKEEPTYEEIPYDLQKIILESYANGTLFIDTNIPPTKVSFNCFEEELTYLYPATSYTVQFISDRNTTADISLGGTQLLAQSIVKGLNKIVITTPETLVDNKLIIDGVGANIKEVVVTNTDRDFGYFEGMKSVGECEDLEIRSINKNLYNFDWTIINTKNDYGTSNGYMGTIQKLKPNTKYYITVKNDNNIDLSLNGYNHVYISGGMYGTIWVVRPGDSIFGNNSGEIITDNTGFVYFRTSYKGLDFLNKLNQLTFQIEEGEVATDYIPHQSNSQTLTHEPLRAVGNVKDRYTLIDGKWYIERNCSEYIITDVSGNEWDILEYSTGSFLNGNLRNYSHKLNSECICDKLQSSSISTINIPDFNAISSALNGKEQWRIKIIACETKEDYIEWISKNPLKVIAELPAPTYEKIDYNPLEVYSDTTHIFTNSTIPCNLAVKNHGYNMVALKENTQYTLYVDKNTTNALTYRLGDYVEINSLSKFTFTTPATLTDKTLRITGKGNSVKDLMLIEGTPANDPVGYFDGLKSSYECEKITDESDENYGKYKVETIVRGKNLFDINKLTPNASVEFTSNGFILTKTSKWSGIGLTHFKVKKYTDYIFKFKVLVTSGKASFTIRDNILNTELKGTTVILPSSEWIEKTIKWNSQERDRIILYFYSNYSNSAIDEANVEFKDIQIEEGTEATEYEPYFESKQTVYLNSPLLKDDEIAWKDNKIQHYHKMNRVVLDGSENFNTGNTNGTTTSMFRYRPSLPCKTNSIICDTFINKTSDIWNSDIETIYSYAPDNLIDFRINKNRLTEDSVTGFKQWLQQNPTTIVYELATPYYEEISPYPLKLSTKENCSLTTESNIQVTQISFNIYEETLAYLYPSTKYYVSFNADISREIVVDLGGTKSRFTTKVGYNKIEITTPADTTNMLTFNGQGINIDHVKVTKQDIDEYFEGMKSVGECENNTLEIICKNNDNSKSNTQTLTHEPLRAVGDIKDKYVLIDGKWYIERNTKQVTFDGSENWWDYQGVAGVYGLVLSDKDKGYNTSKCNIFKNTGDSSPFVEEYAQHLTYTDHPTTANMYFDYNLGINNIALFKQWLSNNRPILIYKLKTPTYEPIDYNPFETYSDITHISTNSLIPTNVVVKNHGYNCILKPSTKYTIALNKPNGTISAKLGGSAKVDSTNSVFTITTPSTLNDNTLRLSGSGNVKDIMVLEGDKTVNTPSYFEGIESVFEQEYDVEKGKYRVTARVEGNGKESSIIFYLNEPLRGTGTAKDRVFVEDGKVVVKRDCGEVVVNDTEDVFIFSDIKETIKYRISKRLDTISIDAFTVPHILSNKLPTKNLNLWSNIDSPCISTDSNGNIVLRTYVTDTGVTKDSIKQWLQANPITVVYQLAEPVYEEADCDLSKLVLENYENSSLIFESNIPVSANIRYSGEVPVVTQAKALSSKVDNTTFDINENIIPYMCDIDYRIVELQLMNGDTQGEGIELLGIGDIEILSNENVLFNNREDKKHNFSYDMLKRDILSQRYSKEEYRYRLDRYLLAEKISDEEYKELEGLLNNGE